jgi:hypothetical protein
MSGTTSVREILVGSPGCPLHLEQREVLLQQLSDGGRGPRVDLLVDLDEEATQCALCFVLGRRTRFVALRAPERLAS